MVQVNRLHSESYYVKGELTIQHITLAGGSASRFPLPVYTADANGGLCIGRRYAGDIPGHCLPLLSTPIEEGWTPLGLVVYFSRSSLTKCQEQRR